MNNTFLYKMLRWLCVIVAVVFLFRFGSEEDKQTAASFEQLDDALSSNADMTILAQGDADKLLSLYGLNAADYASFKLLYPTDFMSVEEILLIEMNDETQAESIRAAIQARLDGQKKFFDGYGSDGQFDTLCDRSHIEVRGNFVIFVVGCDAAWQAYNDAV